MPPTIPTLNNLKFLDFTFLGNTGAAYAEAVLVFLAGLLVFKLLQKIILNYLANLSERTATDLDDTFIEIVRSVRPPFYSYVAFYVAIQFLTLHPTVAKVLDVVLLVWIVYQAVTAVHILIEYAIRTHVGYRREEAAESAVRFLAGLAKWVLWLLGALLILSNLGVNVTSVLAGVGIGGVAIAFALQSILSDLFSSFAIYFDKPFVVGDVIQVGDFIGEVQKIGLKTTRVKALRGEEVIFSNNQLTSDAVQNFGRLEKRRTVFTLGVEYSTTLEKLRQIPELIEEAVVSTEKTEFDRAHFKSFGDSALEFEVSYYIPTDDYKEFMEIQEVVNFKILEALREKKISVAFPTRTVHMKGK